MAIFGILIAESLYQYRGADRPVMAIVHVTRPGIESFFPFHAISCSKHACLVRLHIRSSQNILINLDFDSTSADEGRCFAKTSSGQRLECTIAQSGRYSYGDDVRPYIQIKDPEWILPLPDDLYTPRMLMATILGSLAMGRNTAWTYVGIMVTLWAGFNFLYNAEMRRQAHLDDLLDGANSTIEPTLFLMLGGAMTIFVVFYVFLMVSGILLV